MTKRYGWYPGAPYRPIHYGVDFSAELDSVIAPADGLMYYMPTYDMMHFVPTDDGERSHAIAVFLRHTESLLGRGYWHPCDRGDKLGVHKDIPGKHLHYEVVITPALYWQLSVSGRLAHDTPVSSRIIEDRCIMRDMDPSAVMREINEQMRTDDIMKVNTHTIWRERLPDYKCSRHTALGTSTSVLIDIRCLR